MHLDHRLLLVSALAVATACSKTPAPPTNPLGAAHDSTDVGADEPPAGDDPPGDPPADLPPDPATLSLRGDPTFSVEALTAAERIWYERVQASIDDGWSTITTRAASGDLYELGRNVGDATAALLMALRATGDLTFLDRVAEISDLYREDLADAWLDGTTDGYRNWLWLETPGDPSYGTDNHGMDEAMVHGNVALVAYAFHANRDYASGYADRANFWRHYLEDDFLAKWTAREGGAVAAWDSGFYQRFTHPRSNQLRVAYYLWLLTGDAFYAERAADIAAELAAHVQANPAVPGAYQWKHELQGSDQGWQKINYAQYFMRVVLEMHHQGFGVYASPTEMSRYTSTFRDVVFTKYGEPYSSMALRVDGSEQDGTSVYGLVGFARWDTSGTLLEVAENNFEPGSYGLSTAAYALAAISDREPPPPLVVERSVR
jgi:hypothetical protein